MKTKSMMIVAIIIIAQNIFASIPVKQDSVLYDESKVPDYTLPELLILENGEKVTDIKTWNEKRRPEILNLFAENVYGKTMVDKPEGMHYEVISEEGKEDGSKLIKKKVKVYFSLDESGPQMELNITLPKVNKPVPIFLMLGETKHGELLYDKGYGLANFNPWEIEPDKKDSAYILGIRKYFNETGQTEVSPEEWSTLGVWAWGLSRAMDYLVADPDIDKEKISILGFSRYGKAAMWAAAQDTRFAIVFSCESGCGGAVIVRRGYGETIKAINNQFPHWFCGNLKKYNDRVNDLPVDWHMLIALMAPRPVYISTAEGDQWGDPHGSFLAAKNAEPVYELFGEKGLGVEEEPLLNTSVGETIGYHRREGDHGLNEYDFEQFLKFANKHFNIDSKKE